MTIRMDEGAAELLDTLHRAGYAAYVVGGCVRDSLLGLTPHDWDLCTSALPQQVMELFGAQRCIPTGLQHGTVTVKQSGALYEITTFRTEGTYTDGRHPDEVHFVPDVREDLARRDFTINAMAYNEKEGLVDPFGGQADLQSGIVRAVGVPRQRFTEDALRILRLYRFAARFGFAIDPPTAQAAQELCAHLDCVSVERIEEELAKLLSTPAPAAYLDKKILFVILPELTSEALAAAKPVVDACPAGAENLPIRLAALLLSISIASAELNYILPDSNSRELTWDEVARWDYETLGYAFNEIFARHGYVFHPGEKYDNYFSCQPWYTPNRDTNNQRAVYPYLNATEWANYELIKEVRSYKAENGDSGESMWTYFSGGFDTLGGFDYVQLRTGQNLPVYSAPSRNSWRGANGKASVGTNGAIYSAGWENGWLLVMYETNSGSVRVGYVSGDDIRGGVPMDTSLTFSYAAATLNAGTALTDDPAMRKTTIAQLRAGTQVTYLTSFFNKSAWDYIETTVDGQTTRGFVPAGCLTIYGD